MLCGVFGRPCSYHSITTSWFAKEPPGSEVDCVTCQTVLRITSGRGSRLFRNAFRYLNVQKETERLFASLPMPIAGGRESVEHTECSLLAAVYTSSH